MGTHSFPVQTFFEGIWSGASQSWEVLAAHTLVTATVALCNCNEENLQTCDASATVAIELLP